MSAACKEQELEAGVVTYMLKLGPKANELLEMVAERTFTGISSDKSAAATLAQYLLLTALVDYQYSLNRFFVADRYMTAEGIENRYKFLEDQAWEKSGKIRKKYPKRNR